MSLRVNARCQRRDAYLLRLAEADIAATVLPLCADGVVLEHPCPVTQLPGFQDGWVSVQDGGAQLAVDILDPKENDRVLDACAAPGGKTCHILERCASLTELIAIDHDERRMEKVTENFQRLGLSARTVVADAGMPAAWWNGVPFDRILLDVPCSASGVIRRHPDIKTLRRPGDLDALVSNQRRLLAGLWPTLARGGILVYTTCSVFRCENRDVLLDFLSSHGDAQLRTIDLPLGERDDCGVQIIPGDASMDGFYYAVLAKV
jgi:16S rRNA (cytosine967-C5)-methyltransferase